MTTTDTLITETEGHLLSGDRDEQNRLTNTVAPTDTVLTFDFTLGGIQPGAYVCLDIEVMYVWSVNSTGGTATVQRGMLGSTPATHSGGTIAYVNPLFSKWQIFKALNVEITDLSSADNGLFQEKSFELVTQPVQKIYTVPAANLDLIKVLEIRWQEVGPEKLFPRVRPDRFQVVRDLNNRDTNETGLSLRIEDSFTPGRPLIIRYMANFTTLNLITDDVPSTTGLSPTMLDIPPLGAAARLMGVREAKRAFVERAVNSRRASEVPGGEAARAAGVLLQLLTARIKDEAARLRLLWPMQ